jgi:hypothetical protein
MMPHDAWAWAVEIRRRCREARRMPALRGRPGRRLGVRRVHGTVRQRVRGGALREVPARRRRCVELLHRQLRGRLRSAEEADGLMNQPVRRAGDERALAKVL